MGLAGRKNKQRIGADPRNLTWSDDSSKFGAKYLQSLGWTSGSGLGASGDGRTSNLKIHQKLDLMGIGANRRGVEDAGWKVGREFDGLLARLNRVQNADPSPTADDRPEGEHDNLEKGEDESPVVEGVKPKRETSEKRKRKRSAEEDSENDDKATKRRRKEEKKEKKEKKRAEKEAKKKIRSNSEVEERATEAEVTEPAATPVKVAPRYRAHRARNLASKRLAAASTTGMNEILGIASSSLPASSSIPFPTIMTPPREQPPNGVSEGVPLTRVQNHTEDADQISRMMGLGMRSSIGGGLGFGASIDKTPPSEVSGNDLFRKSGKSVAEYFAEKMRLKTAVKEVVDPMDPATTKSEEPKSKKKKDRK